MVIFALLAIFAIFAAPAAMAGLLLRVRPLWSDRSLVIVAAAPLPVLLAMPSLWSFTAPIFGVSEAFGVNGRDGYLPMFALFALTAAPVAYGIGVISAAIAVNVQR